jgi:hypothetical protein
MNELLTAIGSLWQISLILLIFVLAIMFRVQIKQAFDKRSLTIKKGDFEIKTELIEEATDKNLKQLSTSASTEQNTDSLEKISKYDIVDNKTNEKNEEKPYLIKMIQANDENQLDDIFLEANSKEIDKLEKLNNEAIYLYLKFRFGSTVAISRLEKLCIENKSVSIANKLYNFLGICYKESLRYEDASNKFKIAADSCTDTVEYSQYKVDEYECKMKFSKVEDIISEVIKTIKDTTNEKALFNYYVFLSKLYKENKKTILSYGASEKALSFIANDKDTLFQIAYDLLDDVNFVDVGLLHYLNLIKYDSNNKSALNNIGVAYNTLGIKGEAISYYHKAILLKNSLAASNLCIELINKGFYEEAESLIKKATVDGFYDNDMIKANNYLIKAKENEREEQKKIKETAIEKQKFIIDYVNAYYSDLNVKPSIAGTWSSEGNKVVEINQVENNIVLNWGSLYKYKAEGILINSACELKILKAEYDYSKSESIYKDNGYGYLIFGEKIKLLMFYEGNNKVFPKGEYMILQKQCASNTCQTSEA